MRRAGVLTTRGQSFVAAGAVLLAAGLVLGLGDLVRLGVLLGLLTLVAWLLVRRPAGWVQVERTVNPSRLTVGEHGTVRLTVRHGGRWRSPFVVAQEQLGYALGDRPRFVLPPMAPRSSRVVVYPVRGSVRGEHQLGPLAVRTRDPFGLTSRLTRGTGTHQLLVVPPVLPLAEAGVPGSGQGQDEEVADTVALHGEDDVTIRPYRQGDELRRIHWAASAHTGSLMVRQEEQPSRRRAVVLLDRRASAHAGEGPQASFEWAVVAAASVVAHLQQHGYDVGLITDPAADQEHPVTLDTALDRLARATTSDVPLEHGARVVGRGTAGLVVAVLGADPEGLAALATARRPGTTAVALVVDAAERGDEVVRRGGGAAPGAGGAAEVAAGLRACGWRAAVAGLGTTPGECWREAASRGGRR
ncbi:DUF58 domain-containing protein [Arsenicicoccus dermatophilus]|uniref:DUF58 domain-containing protein n=1 Tax=Arsenicicoccus dermatophilus TaxID=1076331 RepID=UPI00391751BE